MHIQVYINYYIYMFVCTVHAYALWKENWYMCIRKQFCRFNGQWRKIASYAERNSCQSLKECNGDIEKNLLGMVWTDRKSKQNSPWSYIAVEDHFPATGYKRFISFVFNSYSTILKA